MLILCPFITGLPNFVELRCVDAIVDVSTFLGEVFFAYSTFASC